MSVRIVLSTVPDRDVGLTVARALVGERLAACVNVVPGVTSVYRWQGALHEDAEHLLVIKSHSDRLAALERRLVELHPYETPELLALDPSFVARRYLDWWLAATE